MGVPFKKLQVPVTVLMKGSAEALRAPGLTAIMIMVKGIDLLVDVGA